MTSVLRVISILILFLTHASCQSWRMTTAGCPIGQEPEAGGATCTLCAAGYFSDVIGFEECQPCEYCYITDCSTDATDQCAESGTFGPMDSARPNDPEGGAAPSGDQGNKGPTGATGATGEMGPTGAEGPMGPTGEDGAMGPQGDGGPTEYAPPPRRDGSSENYSDEDDTSYPDGDSRDNTDKDSSEDGEQFPNAIDMVPSIRNDQPSNSVTEDQSSKNIVWIIVSVVAVVSALVLFVFAKLSHRQHALKQRNRLHREDIQGNDSLFSIAKDDYLGPIQVTTTAPRLHDDNISLLRHDRTLMGASKKCRNIKTPHGSFSGRAMKWGSRSKSMDNLAYQSTPPIVPKYVDVKVVEKGNMTSIDLVRRAASADEHSPELGNRRPRSRRNSLPAGNCNNGLEGNHDLLETTGEAKRAILNRLGLSFPLSDSHGIIRHCSLKLQSHPTPMFVPSTHSMENLPGAKDRTAKNNKDHQMYGLEKQAAVCGNVNIDPQSIPKERSYVQKRANAQNVNGYDRCTYDVVDCHGSTLKKPQSSVELYIPRKAVPKNSTYTIKHQIHTDLKPFMKYINPHEEDIVGPVVEYSVVNGYEFEKLVCIRVPHCVADANYLCDIRVQYSSDHMVYHDVEKQCKENNVRQKMFFVVDQEYVMIYTKHFTRYLCSCGKRPEVQMEVMLFASYSCLDEQEVALRVFICNVLYTIKDFKQALIDKEGSPALRSTSVNLPTEGLSRDDQFVVELTVKDGKWKPQTIEGNNIHKLVQSKLAVDLYACHLGSYQVPVAAEFVLNPASEECLTFMKGVIEVTLKLAERKPKKSKNPLAFLKKKQTEIPMNDKSGNISVEPTKLWFAYDFSAQTRRSDHTRQVLSAPTKCTTLLQAMNYVSDKLPIRDFKPVCRILGLNEQDLEQLESCYARDLREQKYKGLLLWQQREGYKATVETLTSALKTRELYEMYEHITGHVTESSDDDQVSVNFDIADNNIKPRIGDHHYNIQDNPYIENYQPNSGKVPELYADEMNRKMLDKGIAQDDLYRQRDVELHQMSDSRKNPEPDPRQSHVWNPSSYETTDTESSLSTSYKTEDLAAKNRQNNNRTIPKQLYTDIHDSKDVTLEMSSEQSGLSLTDIIGPSHPTDSSINKSDDKPSTIMVGNVLYSAETKRLMSPEERQWEGSDRFSTEYEPTFKSNQLNNIQYSHNNLTSTENQTNPV